MALTPLEINELGCGIGGRPFLFWLDQVGFGWTGSVFKFLSVTGRDCA